MRCKRLPLELAPVPSETAKELKDALAALVECDVFNKAMAIAARVKELVAPTKSLYNRATGRVIKGLPKDGRSRKQKPTHSSI